MSAIAPQRAAQCPAESRRVVGRQPTEYYEIDRPGIDRGRRCQIFEKSTHGRHQLIVGEHHHTPPRRQRNLDIEILVLRIQEVGQGAPT